MGSSLQFPSWRDTNDHHSHLAFPEKPWNCHLHKLHDASRGHRSSDQPSGPLQSPRKLSMNYEMVSMHNSSYLDDHHWATSYKWMRQKHTGFEQENWPQAVKTQIIKSKMRRALNSQEASEFILTYVKVTILLKRRSYNSITRRGGGGDDISKHKASAESHDVVCNISFLINNWHMVLAKKSKHSTFTLLNQWF